LPRWRQPKSRAMPQPLKEINSSGFWIAPTVQWTSRKALQNLFCPNTILSKYHGKANQSLALGGRSCQERECFSGWACCPGNYSALPPALLYSTFLIAIELASSRTPATAQNRIPPKFSTRKSKSQKCSSEPLSLAVAVNQLFMRKTRTLCRAWLPVGSLFRWRLTPSTSSKHWLPRNNQSASAASKDEACSSNPEKRHAR